MNGLTPWAPEASAFAQRSDALLLTIVGLTGTVAAAIIVLMIFFSVRYRSGTPADRTGAASEHRSRIIEASWIVVPLLLFLGIFVWAADLYFEAHDPPPDSQQIFVVAKQWMWKLQHADGRREINELHVPLGMPVKLIMTSQDVIHSFFLPAMRIKQDVLPGQYTLLWFDARRAGQYHLFCAEYCGTDHSRMTGRLIVMEPAAYAHWLSSAALQATPAASGERLFRTLGCSGCHDPASTVHAPLLDGLYGRPVALADGRIVKADEHYIRDSILLPTRDIAAGYEPVMPSYSGQVNEEQILSLIAYIESLPERLGAAG